MAGGADATVSSSAATPAVRVAGVRKAFGSRTVLDGIDLDVDRGELLTVLGRSGTGKSVLLKLIVGLQAPDAGSIEVAGEEITRLGIDALNRVRRRLGFLFQQAALYDSLTVRENVAFPLRRHTDLSAADRDRRVAELLEQVGMEREGDKLPGQISGGMKKRIGLARAIALDPEVMLLDEPTAGLDPITTAEILELIESIRRTRRTSAVVVTHDLRSVEALADRVVLLHDGAIVAEGPFDVVKKSDHPVVAAFMRPVFARPHD
jgi:phospholipid/cholesterol/gamma-HCH transport system ATP-binding protein